MRRRSKKITTKKVRTHKLKKRYVFGIVVALVVVLRVFVAIQTAMSGSLLAKLEEDVYKLEKQNRKLKQELVLATSLTELQGKTSGLGFMSPGKVHHVKLSDFVAKVP